MVESKERFSAVQDGQMFAAVIPGELVIGMEEEARKRGISKSAIVREAIPDRLKAHAPERLKARAWD